MLSLAHFAYHRHDDAGTALQLFQRAIDWNERLQFGTNVWALSQVRGAAASIS